MKYYGSEAKALKEVYVKAKLMFEVTGTIRDNDLPQYIQDPNTPCLIYADDTTLLVSRHSAKELQAEKRTNFQDP